MKQCEAGMLPKEGAGIVCALPSAAPLLCVDFFCQLHCRCNVSLVKTDTSCWEGSIFPIYCDHAELTGFPLVLTGSCSNQLGLDNALTLSKSPGWGKCFCCNGEAGHKPSRPTCCSGGGWGGPEGSALCPTGPPRELVLPGKARGRMAAPEQHLKVALGYWKASHGASGLGGIVKSLNDGSVKMM